MNIITGASGQIGSMLIDHLKNDVQPVRAIVRNPHKALKDVETKVADFFDRQALKRAFQGGHTVFLLTPENPGSADPIGETATIIQNYKEAILDAGIKKIVGLSSHGAQHSSGTGNLEMSYMLEHAFTDLPTEQVFVRPGYYYSNWLGYLELAKNHGVLPTFFPVDQKIHMISPEDVARFIAGVITRENDTEKIYEIAGPESYSTEDVAEIMSRLFNKEVKPQPIPRYDWDTTLQQAGFSENAAKNMIKMIESVITGKTNPEKKGPFVSTNTGLDQYLKKILDG